VATKVKAAAPAAALAPARVALKAATGGGAAMDEAVDGVAPPPPAPAQVGSWRNVPATFPSLPAKWPGLDGLSYKAREQLFLYHAYKTPAKART